MGVITKKILVADDDANIRDVLRFALARAGYAVCEVDNGRDALAAFHREAPDLIVLDIMMPELEGTEVCRQIRASAARPPLASGGRAANPRVPIIFLSSCDEDADRIVGLELGGDDYVTKPFSPRELVARVKAVLRRCEPEPSTAGGGATDEGADELRKVAMHGRLRLDPNLFAAFWDEREVVLTATEFHLLAGLLRHPGKVYSRAELMAKAYGDDLVVTDRTIDSHIRRIRGKFEALGADPIETVHGVGYKLAPCK